MGFLNRKGQKLSIFIILGVFIILVFGIVNYSSNSLPPVNINDPASVQIFVESCMTLTIMEGLGVLGSQGSIEPQPDFENMPDKVYRFSDENYLVRGEVKTQLEGYVEDNIKDCLSKSNELVLPSTDVEADVVIRNDSVALKMSYGIEVFSENRKRVFDAFTVNVPLLLGKIIGHAGTVVTQGIVLQDYEDVGIVVERLDDIVVVRLYDKENKLKEKDFYYRFVMGS
ncbi:MAG: hypothetical protein QF915_03475 [Candidatus Woesearchaeota archaeon]|jgi:hypothetical protein|nr:hypothetical protein [Candidatus Woesearchaeota archaeon]|tara:strand:+ start:139 stop:819 length:681 start_codon:yes stop_codon:yes gene_type:complete